MTLVRDGASGLIVIPGGIHGHITLGIYYPMNGWQKRRPVRQIVDLLDDFVKILYYFYN